MLHVGLDLHKRFSTVTVMDDNGTVLEQDKLYHDDRARLTEFFRRLAGKAVVTVWHVLTYGEPYRVTAPPTIRASPTGTLARSNGRGKEWEAQTRILIRVTKRTNRSLRRISDENRPNGLRRSIEPQT